MAVTGDTKRRINLGHIAGCQAPADEHAFYLSQIRAPTPRPTRIQRIPTVRSPRMDENAPTGTAAQHPPRPRMGYERVLAPRPKSFRAAHVRTHTKDRMLRLHAVSHTRDTLREAAPGTSSRGVDRHRRQRSQGCTAPIAAGLSGWMRGMHHQHLGHPTPPTLPRPTPSYTDEARGGTSSGGRLQAA